MEASLSSCSLDFGLDFVCLQSTDLLCGTFNLANTPANTVERKLSQVKVAVVRTDNSDTAATVKLVWCCYASTPGASAAGLAVDAAWDTHCQFRCAPPFRTQSSALHSMHLRKRKPHLQFPTIGLLMCLHVLLSPGHSSQGS